MSSTTVILAVVVCGLITRANSKRCLSCREAIRPRDCEYVEECGPNENCSVEKYGTALGGIRYNVGCMDKSKCTVAGRKRVVLNATVLDEVQQKNDFDAVPMEQSDQNYIFCTECCDAELCNIKGCGEEGLDPNSGLLCYACEQENDPSTCNKIKLCSRDSYCHLSTVDVGLDTFYKSDCLSTNLCNHLGLLDSGTHQIVGRRGVERCSKCCSKNLCNSYNCTSVISPSTTTTQTLTTSAPVDGQWGSWMTWSGCSETCGARGTSSRQRNCDNPRPSATGLYCNGQGSEIRQCSVPYVPPALKVGHTYSRAAESQVIIGCVDRDSGSPQNIRQIRWTAPHIQGQPFPTNLEQYPDGSLVIHGLKAANCGPYSCTVDTDCGSYNSPDYSVSIVY